MRIHDSKTARDSRLDSHPPLPPHRARRGQTARHGFLFVVFCFTLYRAMQAGKWPVGRAVMLFIASLIPFVPFWLDQRVKTWEEAAK